MASLSPELITQIGGFPITNTVIATVIVDCVLVFLVFIISKRISQIPGKLQNVFEFAISYFYDLAKSMAGNRVDTIFPWVMTFFIFILFSNFLGLLPGIGSIGLFEKEKTNITISKEVHRQSDKVEHKSHLISLIRPATSDFNATLALAVISLVVTHTLGIRFTGIKYYLSRYFVINPIMLFVGLLELVSEFTKIFSLSFRLFGNIYAGEIVLATISGLFAFLAPLPFLLLESIVAIVQALVFSMLTLVFMTIMTERHNTNEH